MQCTKMIDEELLSDEWFQEAFTDPVTRKPCVVPSNIRALSEYVCRAFKISGICDPMYIANVTAFELGMGSGYGDFEVQRNVLPNKEDAVRLANRFCQSYQSSISVSANKLAEVVSELLTK